MKSFIAILCVSLVAAAPAEDQAPQQGPLDQAQSGLMNWISNMSNKVQNSINSALDKLAQFASSAGDMSKQTLARISELIKDLEKYFEEVQAKATQAANDAQAKAAEVVAKRIEQQIQWLKELEAKLKDQLERKL